MACTPPKKVSKSEMTRCELQEGPFLGCLEKRVIRKAKKKHKPSWELAKGQKTLTEINSFRKRFVAPKTPDDRGWSHRKKKKRPKTEM